MAEREDELEITPPEGLAGGPGPTPPGFDDGTPKPLEGASAGQAGGGPEHPAPRGDPEEPDPS